MRTLRDQLARFLRLGDPKGCAYGEPRCPGGLLCKHDRAEIRHVVEHDPSDVPVDDQLHRYGYAVTEGCVMPARHGKTARALQAQRAREGKPYINERGQLVEPDRARIDVEAAQLLALAPPIDVDSVRRSFGLPEPMPDLHLSADGPGGGSYALHNIVDRSGEIQHQLSGTDRQLDPLRNYYARDPDGDYEPVDRQLGPLVDRDEPPVSFASGFEGSCEACGRLVVVDERIHVYADDVVVHAACPVPRPVA
jgi:hypothetical protein